MNHQEQIEKLLAEILVVDNRSGDCQILTAKLKPEVDQVKTSLREARKAYSLNPSSDSDKKAVDAAQEKLAKTTLDLEEAIILGEALIDRKQELETKLAATKTAFAKAEVEILRIKAQGLAESYTKAIQEAFDSALKLKLLVQMAAARNGRERIDIGGDPSGVFYQVFEGFPLPKCNSGFPVMLRETSVKADEIKRIQQELLQPI